MMYFTDRITIRTRHSRWGDLRRKLSVSRASTGSGYYWHKWTGQTHWWGTLSKSSKNTKTSIRLINQTYDHGNIQTSTPTNVRVISVHRRSKYNITYLYTRFDASREAASIPLYSKRELRFTNQSLWRIWGMQIKQGIAKKHMLRMGTALNSPRLHGTW